MTHVLKACDPKTHVYAHDQLEWENDTSNEYHLLMNNDPWIQLIDYKERI